MNFIKKPFLAILLYALISQLFVWQMQPKPRPPTEYFNVCALENDVPVLANTKESKPNQTLCSQPLDHELQPYGSMHLRELPNHIWELETWVDSMGDPVVYRYQVDT